MALFRRTPPPGSDPPLERDPPAVTEAQVLRAVMEVLPTGVTAWDAQGDLVFKNARADSPSGDYQADALLRAEVEQAAVQAQKGIYDHRVVQVHAPEPAAFAVQAQPLAVGGIAVVVTDVSERTRLDAVRRDFVANVSHELRTPIGALVLLSETLVEEDDPDAVRRSVVHIATEARRAATLIDKLLNLSKVESPRMTRVETVDLAALVRDAAGRVEPMAKQAGVALEIRLPADSCEVQGDVGELTSAVANLVENAVKYSDQGGHVTVELLRDGGEWAVRVADEGIGIPTRDLDRIFERFYRVDPSRGRDTGGAGLGLSIVRHVAANHGGRVTVESREGEGSVFTFSIPVES